MHHLSTIFANNTLKDDEEVIVPALPYLQNMTRIIKETPKRYENRFNLFLPGKVDQNMQELGIVASEL